MKKAFKYLLNYLGLAFLGSLLFGLPAALIWALVSNLERGDSMIDNPWFMSVILVGSQLVPLYFFRKYKWGDFSSFKIPKLWRMLLWITLGWVGIVLVEMFVQTYTPIAEWDIETLQELAGMAKNPLGFISCCILAPIVEEGVFRGAIERRLLERDWNPWWAIVISALIFAGIHMNLSQGVAAFLMGLLFGWIYYRTRNIWLCVFGHALNNTYSSVMNLIFDNNFDTNGLTSQESASLLVFVPIMLVGVFLMILSCYLVSRQQSENEKLMPATIVSNSEPADVVNVPPIPLQDMSRVSQDGDEGHQDTE